MAPSHCLPSREELLEAGFPEVPSTYDRMTVRPKEPKTVPLQPVHIALEPILSPRDEIPGLYHLTCYACGEDGHRARKCPKHPHPFVLSRNEDVLVRCAIHNRPRSSKNMRFDNELSQWTCFPETRCKSVFSRRFGTTHVT
mmetsp:Transcript_20882/g.32573  ORF Transcript_20882/g.32573 Transcript_20882/m.32573 type:complete len:141 (+) Transcript_20882:31-453(+)